MDQQRANGDVWKRVRLFGMLVAVAFAATFAAIVATRLSDQALAVIAGVVCGVSAALPTSLAVLGIARWRSGAAVQPNTPQAPYPPVVVISPPTQPQGFPNQPGLPPSLTGPIERHFTVVGGTYGDTPHPGAPDDW